MSEAIPLIRECQRRGVRLMVTADQLEIDGPRKALTKSFLDNLKHARAEIIAAVGERVIKTCRNLCKGVVDPDIFYANLDGEDVADILSGAITDEQLRGFAHMMADRFTRENGRVPRGYTGGVATK